MALARPHIVTLMHIKRALSPGPVEAMLELGEQNWFCDVNPADITGLIESDAPADKRAELQAQLKTLLAEPATREWWSFDIAKLFYRLVFDYKHYDAIDLHGSPAAMRLDLNEPVNLPRQYDVVTNFGTLEHVFNVAESFRTMHNATLPGGLMLHSLPNQGVYDHGFYNFHPTFVVDLCMANRYDLLKFFYIACTPKPAQITALATHEDYVRLALADKLDRHSGLMAVIRKPKTEAPFCFPRQGYYDDKLSPELREAWQKLPR